MELQVSSSGMVWNSEKLLSLPQLLDSTLASRVYSSFKKYVIYILYGSGSAHSTFMYHHCAHWVSAEYTGPASLLITFPPAVSSEGSSVFIAHAGGGLLSGLQP